MLDKPAIDSENDAPVDTETSAAEYTKGNPKRGALRILVMVLAGLGLAAFFFTSDKSTKSNPIDAAVTRPMSNSTDDMARQLKADANLLAEKQKALAPPVPPVPQMPAPTMADATPKLTEEELMALRREKAAASPMDASEVAIGIGGRLFGQGPSDDRESREAAAIRKLTEDTLSKAYAKEPISERSRKIGSDEAFLASNSSTALDDITVVKQRPGDHAIAPGTIIRLVLLRGINTDSPGQITAQVVSNVYDSLSGRRLLIPKGSRVIGVYSSDFSPGQRRVVMAMTRLDMPNGTRISLSGSPAADTQGYSGLAADVDNHYFSMFGASLMVGAASMLLPKDQQTTTSTTTASGTQNAGTVFGNSLESVVKVLADRNKIIKPTATIEPGEVFSFSTTKEVLMGEYRD